MFDCLIGQFNLYLVFLEMSTDRYGSQTKSFPEFQLGPLNLALEPGMVMGYIGPNGSGKTTTMHCMVGLVKPDAGEVEIFGRQNDPNITVSDSLHLLSLNAQSIKGTDLDKNKLIDFRQLVDIMNPDIMTVTETWLKDTVTDNEVTDKDTYNLYRKDIRGHNDSEKNPYGQLAERTLRAQT